MIHPVSDYETKTSGSPQWEADADLVVVGGGVAGLSAALRSWELGLRVLVLTKAGACEGSTPLAQGGVAVVLPGEHEEGDSVDAHARDTHVAGAGLCVADAVREVVTRGPTAVANLRGRGARFDASRNHSGLARATEGGHSAFRVLHAGGDATGAEVQRALDAARHGADIPILERHVVVDALQSPAGAVCGVYALDAHGVPGVVHAPAVLLATGGCGQLYQATSNPEIATGDGLALALRAGASVVDVEFVQFHPTVLYVPGACGRRPLVTEAVRGEGATLIDAAGEPVMRGVHPRGDLAPRDVVSAAITRRTRLGPGGVDDHVFLDAAHIPRFARRFPTVHAACVRAGIDPTREPIPVAPAAHFACGGVAAGVDGRTGVTGLYAAGELARTGLHGANRLASNSLLEGMVAGTMVAESIGADTAAGTLAGACGGELPRAAPARRANRELLQRVMSRYAGIGRDAEGLEVAGSWLDVATVDSPLRTVEQVEDAALTLVAQALIAAAARRRESRGCHVRADFPERDDRGWRHSQVIRLNPSGQPVLADPINRLEGAA